MKSIAKMFVLTLILSIGYTIVHAKNRYNQVATSTARKAVDNHFVRDLLKHNRQKTMNNSARNVHSAARKMSSGSGSRTTSELAERLIGETGYGYSVDTSTFLPIWSEVDSSIFMYSGTRTSYFDYNYMTYYDDYNINGAGIFGFGNSPGFRDHNNLPDMLCDTEMIWSTNLYTLTFGQTETRYSIYDTNNNILNYTDYYVYGEGWQNVNTYDAFLNITSSMYLMADTPLWDTAEYRIFEYNSSPQLVEDSTSQYYGIGSWGPEERYLYTYDGYGNMIQASYYDFDTSVGAYTEYYRWAMTYYGDTMLQSVTLYSVDSGVLTVNTIDSFGWSSGVAYTTYNKHYDFSDGYVTDITETSKHITDSLPDTTYYNYMDSTGTIYLSERTSYTYDSYWEPTVATTYLFNDSTSSYDSLFGVSYYYYELYEEIPRHGDAVNNAPALPPTINIYPNPANNELNIYRPGISSGAYTAIKLINAAGQTVLAESLPWLSETETVSLKGLIPGIYWIEIADRYGNILSRQGVEIK